MHSPDEQTMLENLCQTLSLSHTWDMMDHRGFANSCWIGLTDNENHQSMGANLGVSEGRFGWTDRSPLDCASSVAHPDASFSAVFSADGQRARQTRTGSRESRATTCGRATARAERTL